MNDYRPLIFFVISAAALSLCGCNADTGLRPNVRYGDSRDEVAAASVARLKCSVELVSGADGGALYAKGDGWICLRWENLEKVNTTMRTASFFGKGGSDTVSPAWKRPSDYPYYAGFGLVQCKYEFVSAKGQVIKEGELGPPDEPLELNAGQMKLMWRPIAAPNEAGKYTLRITVNQDRLTAALSSYNFVGETDENPGTTELRLNVNVVDRGARPTR